MTTFNVPDWERNVATIIHEATHQLAYNSGMQRRYADNPMWVSEGLATAWLVTVFAWWWARKPRRERREPQEPPLHKQQARILKSARKAARENDADGVKAALLSWARLQWPEKPPRSLGDLATRVSEPMSAELQNLCSASYGPRAEEWDGAELAASLRSFVILKDEKNEPIKHALPPLLPNSPA